MSWRSTAPRLQISVSRSPLIPSTQLLILVLFLLSRLLWRPLHHTPPVLTHTNVSRHIHKRFLSQGNQIREDSEEELTRNTSALVSFLAAAFTVSIIPCSSMLSNLTVGSFQDLVSSSSMMPLNSSPTVKIFMPCWINGSWTSNIDTRSMGLAILVVIELRMVSNDLWATSLRFQGNDLWATSFDQYRLHFSHVLPIRLQVLRL